MDILDIIVQPHAMEKRYPLRIVMEKNVRYLLHTEYSELQMKVS